MKVSATEILENAHQLKINSPELRFGQSVYIAAYSLDPVATYQVSNTEKDCFYLDSRVNVFLEAVEAIQHRRE